MNSDPSVLLVNANSINSGIGRYSDDLLKVLGSNGQMYSLIMDKRYLFDQFPGFVKKGFFVPLVSGGWTINYILYSLAYWEVHRRVKNQLISGGIVHYTDPFLKPWKLKGKNVVTIHDLFFYKDRSSPNNFLRRAYLRNLEVYKNFDNVLTVSRTMQKELLEFGIQGEVSYIYPPVSVTFKLLKDKEKLKEELGIPTNKKCLLSISNMVKRKNNETVVKALNLLGDGYFLVRVGKDLGIGKSFQNVSQEKLNLIYNACDALIFPTLGEGFGSPVIEAMATGLPVVASNIEIMREIASDAAVLTEPTPEATAEGIKEALENREKYVKLGLDRASKFSFDRYEKEQLSYYKKI